MPWAQTVSLPVWIEPKWNWNFIQASTVIVSVKVWIEPKWNWNSRSLGTQAGSYSMFESNQSGIETDVVYVVNARSRKFESNQSGIETVALVLHLRFQACVWIEPEWNWNDDTVIEFHSRYVSLNRTRVELKLRRSSGQRTVKRYGLNRTRVELKPWPQLNPKILAFSVWIEPEWNWNNLHSRERLVAWQFESNQSGIETRYFCEEQEFGW